MKNILLQSLVFSVLLCFALASFAQVQVIHCGQLLDVKEGKMLKEITVKVEGKMIQSVEKGYIPPKEGEELVDLKNGTLMPGWIDMHVHIESETSADSYLKRYTSNEADIAYRAQVYGMRTLKAGFTTVRDLGGSGVNVALRNAINAGLVDGPRIFTCEKSLATTGGHADPSNSMRSDLAGDPGPKDGVINGPAEARKGVRQRYKNGADVIKITATGGVLSPAKDGSGPQFDEEELMAIVATAKDYGMHVAAHAHGAEGMKRALRAGVLTIEHGTLMDDEAIALFKKHEAYYVPTITAGRTVADSAKNAGYYPAMVAVKAIELGPKIQATFGKAYKAGVNIAFGTDAGVFPHGYNAREFVYMHEAGMPVIEAIRSATLTNARILGMEKQLGQIRKGFLADLVAVPGNPIDNVQLLEQVNFVMKEGKIYRNDSL